MIATGRRLIRPAYEYEQFFKKPVGENLTIKKGATVRDTIRLMKRLIVQTADETKRIANHLRGTGVFQTCQNIWNFCFHHFQYKMDEPGYEQVRHPERSFSDKAIGIDCDDNVVLICSMLNVLRIPFLIRTSRYEQPEMEHTYPVVLHGAEEIVMDCVVHQFNYEVPYTAKKDYYMELQELNGIPGQRFNEFGDTVHYNHDLPIDAADLFGDEIAFQQDMRTVTPDAEPLAGKEERAERKEDRQQKREEKKANPGAVKTAVKKTVHAINKVNPVAAALRGGILAAMKLNLFQIASKLRFAYWTPAEAEKNGMDMAKFNQLQQIRAKLEKIYFNAGGNAPTLKEAIMTGKGNQDRMVQLSGFGSINLAVKDEDSLRTILGEDLFHSEINGIEGLSGLGAVLATGAAVTAASGVLASISALIKKLGNLFKKGTAAHQKVEIKANTDASEEKTRKFSVRNIVQNVKTKIAERKDRKTREQEQGVNPDEETATDPAEFSNENLPEELIPDETFSDESAEESETRSAEDEAPIVDEPKPKPKAEGTGPIAWIKANPGTTAIGLGVLALLSYGGYYLYKKSQEAKAKQAEPSGAISGVTRKEQEDGDDDNFSPERIELM